MNIQALTNYEREHMPNLITLDFETFYDTGYGLNRLTTEEYIKSPQFQVIGVAIKVNDGTTTWYSGTREELQKTLDAFRLGHFSSTLPQYAL